VPSQSQYAWVLEIPNGPTSVFTWAVCAKKYLRDLYTDADGELKLPPPGYLVLKRYRVNPKAGHAVIIEPVSDIERFLAN
jgi:hypothetical protein